MALRDSLCFFLVFILLSSIHFCNSQFPTSCTSAEGLLSHTCCPTPDGFDEECGGPGRGVCANIPPSDEGFYEPHMSYLELDDRSLWPYRFFNRTCLCEFPFGGADCSDCAYSYSGEECTQRNIVVRRNIASVEGRKMADKFISYIQWAKGNLSDYSVATSKYRGMFNEEDGTMKSRFTTVSIYNYFVYIHSYACFAVTEGDAVDHNQDWAHSGPAFPTWHRAYMMLFENALQKLSGDYDFAIPYWDWTNATSCEVCTDELFGLSDLEGLLSTSPYFKDWMEICGDIELYIETGDELCDPNTKTNPVTRNPGTEFGARLPFKKEVGFLFNINHYDTPPYSPLSNCSFRNVLGGNGEPETGISVYSKSERFNHGMVHIYLGGTMSVVPSSVSDPVFWSHHSFIDKIIEMWFRQKNMTEEQLPENSAPMGHARFAYLVPHFPVIKHSNVAVKSVQLGYTYDDVDINGFTPDFDDWYNDDCGACCTS